MTIEIVTHIKERQRLHKKYLKRPLAFGAPYRACRNKVNKMLKDVKDNYYNCKIDSEAGGSKCGWKILNQILNTMVNSNIVIESMNINNITVINPNIISNYINSMG